MIHPNSQGPLNEQSYTNINISLEPDKTPTFKWMFGEFQPFPLVKVWNHPIETTIKIRLFRVPGVNHPTDHQLSWSIRQAAFVASKTGHSYTTIRIRIQWAIAFGTMHSETLSHLSANAGNFPLGMGAPQKNHSHIHLVNLLLKGSKRGGC